MQASLLFNGEKPTYVKIKAQTFSIWFLILIYGWWPWQVLSISNSGQSSMKLWVFSSCGAGSTGWVCSQYKAGLGGWELNVLHKGGTVSWWQRITTGLGPTSSFSFALPRMHSGRDYQGSISEYETLLFCLLSSGLLLKGTVCRHLLSNKGTAGSQLCRNRAGGNWTLPMASKEEEGRESSSFLLWAAAALLKPDRLAVQSEERGVACHCNPHVLQS